MATRLTRRRGHVAAVAVLCALAAVFFAPMLFEGKAFTTVAAQERIVWPWAEATPHADTVPAQSDQSVLSHPWQVQLTHAVHQGTIPMWDAHEMAGGYPLYSNGSSAELYLPHLVTAATLDPTSAHDWISLFHVLFAGIFTYFLLRELRASWAAGMLAATSWMFGGFNAGWLHFDVTAPVQLFVPLDLFLVHRAARLRTWPSYVLAGLGLGYTMDAGHVLWLGMTAGIAATWFAALQVRTMWQERSARLLVPSAVVALIAGGTAAVELLPFLKGIGGAQRKHFTYADLYGSVKFTGVASLSKPSDLLHLFWPEGHLDVETLNNSLLCVGTLAGVLSLVGLFSRRPGSALGRWLMLLFGLATIGGPVTWFGYHLVPLFNVLSPYGRWDQWASFGVALLGGLGLDAVLRRLPELRWPHWRPALVGALLIASAAQVLVVARGYQPAFADPAEVYPATPLTTALQSWSRTAPWPARAIPLTGTEQPGVGFVIGPGDQGDLLGVDVSTGYDSVIPLHNVGLMRWLEGVPLDQVQHQAIVAFAALPLSGSVRYDQLARFGITAMVTMPGYRSDGTWGGDDRVVLPQHEVFHGSSGTLIQIDEPAAGPRVVTGLRTTPDDIAALQTYSASGFRWQTTAVLTAAMAGRLTAAQRSQLTGDAVEQSVTSVRATVNHLRMAVTTSRPGLLVLPQSWNAGWSVTVGGRPATLVEADYAQSAVMVPAGTSEVALTFRPTGFVAGATVSAATVGVSGLGLLADVVVRRRRRRGGPGHGQLEDELVGEERRSDPEPDALHA